MPQRPDHAVTVETTVAFNQCDPLGVAWHGRYLEWMEAARTALFASRNLDVPELVELGHRMYVVDARVRYMAPLTYGDPVHVTAWFSQLEPLIRVAYDVRHGESGRWCARAHTVLATTDRHGELLTSIPGAVLERLPAVAAHPDASSLEEPA